MIMEPVDYSSRKNAIPTQGMGMVSAQNDSVFLYWYPLSEGQSQQQSVM